MNPGDNRIRNKSQYNQVLSSHNLSYVKCNPPVLEYYRSDSKEIYEN